MSYWQKLVPPDFQVPPRLEGDGFHLRMLTVNDVVKDYDAVMSSAARLKGAMKPGGTWPEGLTLEEDLIDLGWHQREFLDRRSFCYTVMSPDESVCLGCCYIYPSEKPGFDAKAFWWVRTSAVADGLDERLGRPSRAGCATAGPSSASPIPAAISPGTPGAPRAETPRVARDGHLPGRSIQLLAKRF